MPPQIAVPKNASKIAFISTLDGVPWGGSEVLWQQAASHLLDRGLEIYTNTHGWPKLPAPLAALQDKGARLTLRKRSTLRRLAERAVPSLRESDMKWLDTARPDLVLISLHCHSFGLEWMQACAARGIPYAILIEAVVEHFWCGDLRQKALANAYNQAAGLYFVSHGNHRQVRTQLADALPRGEVVRNPFNVSYDTHLPWPHSGSNQESTLQLACVARLEPANKGQDILCEVLNDTKWKARNLNLTFFGDGPFKQSLLALVEYLGLNNKVRYGGFVNDIEKVWAEHHALVLASRAEGLPLAVVEAMLCGRPCVVTDVAGNAELLEDNVSGFVAAAPKAQFVDEALERLWQRFQDGTLQECGNAAAIQVRKLVPQNPAQEFADKLQSLL